MSTRAAVKKAQDRLRVAQGRLRFAQNGGRADEIRIAQTNVLAAQADLETVQQAEQGNPPANAVDPAQSPAAAQADKTAEEETQFSFFSPSTWFGSDDDDTVASADDTYTDFNEFSDIGSDLSIEPTPVEEPEDNRNFLQRALNFTPPPAEDNGVQRSAFGAGGFRGTALRVKQAEVVEDIEDQNELLQRALANGKTDVAANLQASIERDKAELEQINEGLEETTGVDRFEVDPDTLQTKPEYDDASLRQVRNPIPEDVREDVTVENVLASEDINIQTEFEREQQLRDKQVAALREQARNQATVREQRKANGSSSGDGDWRVRLRLAPNATYLYKNPAGAGILAPLLSTDGIIFPYTPQIDIQYRAEYQGYDPTHSNYRHYFYKGSRVEFVTVTADFTAQDTQEAEYLLAVIHFLKSASKMFYGQDAERGSPPPLLYFSGLGSYQFNEAPCVIQEFNYNLPNDVDYIRAGSRQINGTNSLQFQRPLSTGAAPSYSLSSIWDRLRGANLPSGATPSVPPPGNLGLGDPTYVPTKMSMTITMLPVQSRSQVSRDFSLRDYASGNLIKNKGFW